jgi:hypothetical protein
LNAFFHVTQNDKRNNRTTQIWIECFGLPQTEKQPVRLLFFGFGLEADNKAIRAGRKKRFSAVVSFVQDKEMRI